MNDVATKSSGPLTYLDAGYRHYSKLVTPRQAIELNGARLKWYDLARAETPSALIWPISSPVRCSRR